MQNDDRPFYAKERPQTPEMTAVRLMRLTIRVRWVMMIMSRRIIALRPVTMTIILIMIMVIMVVIALLLNAAAADDDEVDEDIYIMMQCMFVTKNHNFLLGVSCNHLNYQ